MNEMMKKTNEKIVIENNYGVKIEFEGRKTGNGTSYIEGDKHWNEIDIYQTVSGNYIGVWTFIEYRKVKDVSVYISNNADDLFDSMTWQWECLTRHVKDAFNDAFREYGFMFVEV